MRIWITAAPIGADMHLRCVQSRKFFWFFDTLSLWVWGSEAGVPVNLLLDLDVILVQKPYAG